MRQPVQQRHRGHSAPGPSLVPLRPSRPPHGRTGSQFQVLLPSEGSLSRGSMARRAGSVGTGRGPTEPGQEAGDADSTSPSFSQGARAERGTHSDLESILRVLLRIPAMGPGSRARDISESCTDPPSPLSTLPRLCAGDRAHLHFKGPEKASKSKNLILFNPAVPKLLSTKPFFFSSGRICINI